eukprot:6242521-Prymnesium_polylepis.1
MTIYGAVFDFTRPQQDSPAERQSDEHDKGSSQFGYREPRAALAACHGTQDARRDHSAVVSAL